MRGRPARLRTFPLLGEYFCFVFAWVIRSSGAMCRVLCVFCHAHLEDFVRRHFMSSSEFVAVIC